MRIGLCVAGLGFWVNGVWFRVLGSRLLVEVFGLTVNGLTSTSPEAAVCCYSMATDI